ncbi:hypothetical protein BMF94_3563 [Rhodotorula taiwanensis]|uniref:THIF-type NAD/FAD binding fold domain-containing protein n=1 Tax=Rhodotorula taiwanensis TaxID=741276 RepID=A0A2S5B8X9_9BASI|nr:hypothetical protein BMF94_3563 [Rhodotorula taiwanensis]
MGDTSTSSLLVRLGDAVRSPAGRMATVAVVSSAMTVASVFAGQALRRTTKRHHLADSVRDIVDDGNAVDEDELVDFTKPVGSRRSSMSTAAKKAAARSGGSGRKKGTSEVIIREALARNYAFFGDDKMAQVRDKFVVVVGVGGVGSAAAAMLVRSGIRRIRIIDFDQVSLSSLNRHSTATLAQVGTPKVTSCADYFAEVAPWVEVDARIALFEKDQADDLLDGNPDYVIDCIDNIDSKVDLLAYCHQRKIPVFSSLGAAAKSDPSRIQVADISTTFEDPLAKSVRRRLRIAGVPHGVPVVYSTEKPRPDLGLLPLPDEEYEKGKVDELHAISNFRVRILPVLGPLPAMFGNVAAAYVLTQLAGFKMEPLPVKNRYKLNATLHRQLSAVEQKLTGDNRIPFTEDDMGYIFEEIHRAKSVVPPHGFPSRPTILRWKKDRGLAWDNLVVFDREEGAQHEARCLLGNEDPEAVWGEEVTALVERRSAEERRLHHYRI